jgi:hypothetical protein
MPKKLEQLDVFFIEDEEIYIDTYKELLKEMGDYQFSIPVVINDEKSALVAIKKWASNPNSVPDLLFLDLILPKTLADYKDIQNNQNPNSYVSEADNHMDTDAGIAIYDKIRGSGTKSKKHPELCLLPIIILTADYRLAPSTRANMLDDEYLLWIDKPFLPEDKAGKVSEFLRKLKG